MQKKHIMEITATSTNELPTQIVMDFFEQGIAITNAPKDIVLKKSNAAIRVISTLGLLERKMVDACVFIAGPRMNDGVLHVADLEYFKWLLSYNSQNRDHLKRAITNIQQTLIQINIYDEKAPDKDFWHSTNFLYDVSITNGKIYFRIPESIRQPLSDPKSWTYLSFRIKNRFTSEYAYILYERCRADQFRGATDWWDLADFRKITNTVDIYSYFQDLQKRVIKPAIEQINEFSDIYITADYKTRGRTKTHVRFIVEENPNVLKFEHDKEKMPHDVFDALKEIFGFSNSQVDEVADYPLDYLIQKIEFTKYRIANSKTKIGRPDSYLMKALKEDLRFNASEVSLFEAEKNNKKQVKVIEEKKVAQEVKSKLNEDILLAFNLLGEDEKKEIVDAYKATDEFVSKIKPIARDKKFDLDSTIVRRSFVKYLHQNTELGVKE